VPTAEGEAFAGRTGCLFVEASAKTAVGVTEAFNDVVARIIDTPSLWREDTPRAGGGGPMASRPAASGPGAAGRIMPGNVDLSEAQDEDASGTCLC
jgi:Ras-related protein Rab-18